MNTIVFEYEEIIDDNLTISLNNYDVYISGKYKIEEIIFKLHGNNWVEIL